MQQSPFPIPIPLSEAEILRQAVEMLAIGNVAVRRAQARNRARGIPNYYSVGGRIVSDLPVVPSGQVQRNEPL